MAGPLALLTCLDKLDTTLLGLLVSDAFETTRRCKRARATRATINPLGVQFCLGSRNNTLVNFARNLVHNFRFGAACRTSNASRRGASDTTILISFVKRRGK